MDSCRDGSIGAKGVEGTAMWWHTFMSPQMVRSHLMSFQSRVLSIKLAT